MGDSDKLEDSGPEAYRFVEHRQYLDAFLEQMDIRENLILVLHDWGSALGFDWAYRHPEKVRAIAYMEAIVQPLNWSDWPEQARKIFKKLRPAEGEELVLKNTAFPGSILIGTQRQYCRSWPNQQEITVRGIHFLQEDSPDAIGEAVAAFIRSQNN